MATSPSPDGTVIASGAKSAITDAGGALWTITSGGQVAVGGKADATTASVVQMVYSGGKVYQQNKALGWWSKTSPAAPWVGTTAPVPPVVVPPAPTVTHVTVAAEIDAAMTILTSAKAHLAGLKP